MTGHERIGSVTELHHVGEAILPCRPPFDFRHTFWKPSQFPTGLEAHTRHATWRTLRVGDELAGVKARPVSGGVRIEVFAEPSANSSFVDRVLARVRHGYGLEEDLSGFYEQVAGDPCMAGPMEHLRGMRVSCPESAFEIGVVAVLLQNCNIGRTVQMLSSLLDWYGRVVEFDGVRLKVFFLPEDVTGAPRFDLRYGCVLGYRDEYVARLASFFQGRDLDRLTLKGGAELARELKSVKGIGPFTARFVAQRALRDRDATPLDVWNSRILADAMGLGTAEHGEVRKELEERFPGNAGIAMQYLIEHQHLERPITLRYSRKEDLLPLSTTPV